MNSSKDPSNIHYEIILGAVEAGVAAGSAGIGELMGGSSGAVVAAALAPTVSRVVRGFLDDRRKNLQQLISETITGLPTEVIERAFSKPEHRLLFARSLEAAARTANEAKIKALARVLQSCLASDDDTSVDVSIQIVDTLSSLEVLHLRLLSVIEASASTVEENKIQGVTRREIINQQPSLNPVIDKIIEDTVRLGLIFDNSQGRYNAGLWHQKPMMLTDYGARCLEHLREMDTDES